MVGELIWLVTRTRVDLAFTVHRAAALILKDPERFTTIIKRLLRFLQGSQDHGLSCKSKNQVRKEAREAKILIPRFYEEHLSFTNMSFAPWGGASQACQLESLWTNPVQWKAQRQSIIALSTCEGELMAACEGFLMGRSNDHVFREIVENSEVEEELKDGVVLAVDNMAAVGILGNDSAGNWRTRHLKVRSAAVHQAIEDKALSVVHCPGTEQVADVGTKTLSAATLNHLKSLMGMESLSWLEKEEVNAQKSRGQKAMRRLVSLWALKILEGLGVEAKEMRVAVVPGQQETGSHFEEEIGKWL
jgi:histone deacetylase 1/2